MTNMQSQVGEEKIMKYFQRKNEKYQFICFNCAYVITTDGYSQKTIKCPKCGKRVINPKSQISPGAFIENYLIRGFESENYKTFTLKCYLEGNIPTKIKILKPPFIKDKHETAVFLKEIIKMNNGYEK